MDYLLLACGLIPRLPSPSPDADADSGLSESPGAVAVEPTPTPSVTPQREPPTTPLPRGTKRKRPETPWTTHSEPQIWLEEETGKRYNTRNRRPSEKVLEMAGMETPCGKGSGQKAPAAECPNRRKGKKGAMEVVKCEIVATPAQAAGKGRKGAKGKGNGKGKQQEQVANGTKSTGKLPVMGTFQTSPLTNGHGTGQTPSSPTGMDYEYDSDATVSEDDRESEGCCHSGVDVDLEDELRAVAKEGYVTPEGGLRVPWGVFEFNRGE